MITPSILKRGTTGVSDGLPALTEPYLTRPDKTYPTPDPYIGSPRYPADHALPKEGNAPVAPRQTSDQRAPAQAPAMTPAPKPDGNVAGTSIGPGSLAADFAERAYRDAAGPEAGDVRQQLGAARYGRARSCESCHRAAAGSREAGADDRRLRRRKLPHRSRPRSRKSTRPLNAPPKRRASRSARRPTPN